MKQTLQQSSTEELLAKVENNPTTYRKEVIAYTIRLLKSRGITFSSPIAMAIAINEPDQRPIKALRMLAYITLVGGVTTAILAWYRMAYLTPSDISLPMEGAFLGILLGAAFLVAGVLGFVFFLVIAGMAENLMAIRFNTQSYKLVEEIVEKR